VPRQKALPMNDAQLPIWVRAEQGQAPAWFVPEGWGAFLPQEGKLRYLSERELSAEAKSEFDFLMIPRETEVRVRLTGLDERLGVELAALDLIATLDFFPQALPQSRKMTLSLEQLLRSIGSTPLTAGTRIEAPYQQAVSALDFAAQAVLKEHGNAVLEDDELIDSLPARIAALASNHLRKQESGIEVANVKLHDMHPAQQELPLWRGDAEARYLGSFFPGLAQPRYAESMLSLGNTSAVLDELDELLRLLTFEGLATSQELKRTAEMIVDDESTLEVADSVETLLARLRPRVLAGKAIGNVVSMPMPGNESEALVFARIRAGKRTLGRPISEAGHPDEGPTASVQLASYLIGLTPISHHFAWLMGVPGAKPGLDKPITGGSASIFDTFAANLGPRIKLPSEAQWFAASEPGRIQTGIEWCRDTYWGDVYAHPHTLVGPAASNHHDATGRGLRSVRDASMGIHWRSGKPADEAVEGICWRMAIDLEEESHE